MKGGTYFAIGSTMGPAGDGGDNTTTYSIGGVLYLDVNENGQFDADEPVISNVTVSLLDAAGNELASIYSDNDGLYNFSGLTNGDYSVVVADATIDEGDFNEGLAQYFADAETAGAITLNAANVTDANFGFVLSVQDVVDDIDTNDPDADGFSFTGTGKTIGYWKHQHSVAIKGKGRAHVDEATLNLYLAQIETLWLAEPFQFGVSALDDSRDILSAKTSDANELLLKQLLACELNYVDGRGIDDAQLHGLVLAWAEYLSAYSAQYSREVLLETKDLLDMINNSGD